MRGVTAMIAAMTALQTSPASAEVVDRAQGGFVIRHQLAVDAPPATLWGVLVHPARWWGSPHTYSGDAANLRLDAHPGGCWCEALPMGGGVEHMRVLYVQPGERLRMTGGLGPLQTMAVIGVLEVLIAPMGDGSVLTVTYSVGGYAPAGLQQLAGPVDQVLGDQVARLKAVAEVK